MTLTVCTSEPGIWQKAIPPTTSDNVEASGEGPAKVHPPYQHHPPYHNQDIYSLPVD